MNCRYQQSDRARKMVNKGRIRSVSLLGIHTYIHTCISRVRYANFHTNYVYKIFKHKVRSMFYVLIWERRLFSCAPKYLQNRNFFIEKSYFPYQYIFGSSKILLFNFKENLPIRFEFDNLN